MKKLPSAIIDVIFTYCSTKEMLLIIERVCSLWLVISKNGRTTRCWNHVDVTDNNCAYNIQGIIKLLNQRINRRQITSLYLKEVSSLDSIFIFNKLHTLSFGCDFHSLEGILRQNIYNDLSLLTSLSKLTIEISDCVHWHRQNFIHKINIPSLSQLTDLTLINSSKRNISVIIDGNAFSLLRSLRCTSKDNINSFQVDFMNKISTLEICHIEHSDIRKDDIWLKTAESLRSFCVRIIDDTDESYENDDLTVRFHPNAITRLKILHIISGTYFNCLFKFINLSHLTIPEEAEIANTVPHLPFLTSLGVNHMNDMTTKQTIELFPQVKYINGQNRTNFLPSDLLSAKAESFTLENFLIEHLHSL